MNDLPCKNCKPRRTIFRDTDGHWAHRATGFIACHPDGPLGKYAEPAPAGRPSTPPRRNNGVTTITVQRACNGCGTLLGNATTAELEAAVAGRDQPDVTDECPQCSPDTWAAALEIGGTP